MVRDLLPARPGRSVLIGDGMSDLAARPAVNLVVGFGGVITRQNVVNEAEVFVKSQTLAPILALALSNSQSDQARLSPYHALLDKGWGLIKKDEVIFQDYAV